MPNPLFDALFAQHIGANTPFLHLPAGSIWTHDRFLRRAAQFANTLTDHGLKPGDRLAVQISKSPDALALYAACVQAGVVFLPLNPAYTPPEVAYFVDDSDAGLLICADDDRVALQGAVGAPIETLNADGTGTFAQSAQDQPETFSTATRSSDDLAALLYTSGTTGRSKGAMLTQANLLSNAETLAELWQFTADDCLLHALPIFHTHGLFVATNVTLIAGGAMAFLPKFDPDAIFAALPRATAMMGVPTFYTRLLDDPRLSAKTTTHMRLFISGSAPLLADTHTAFEARTGHRILERYGMTETNMTTSNPYAGERRPGTVGPPLPGVEVKICDDNGNSLPSGEIGMLEVRGPNVFSGYWQMPDKTAAEIRPDGFFITGDLARIDPDGYVQIVGRDKDLIISGGFNIYPKEVELALDAQPGVLESAVIGIPHPDMGEAVVGILVAEPGTTLDTAEISTALSASLARFKQPRRLIVVDALPRNTMGKVQKNILRDAHNKLFDTHP